MDVLSLLEIKPPKETCYYLVHDREIRESVSSMITILTTAADIGSDHPPWTHIKVFRFMQNSLLSRVPCSHFLPVFERVGRVVQKMILVDLAKLYTDFAETFLRGLSRRSPKIKLPCRANLEYILIRTQCSAKLICETLSYVRNIFCYLVERLNDGPDFHAILSASSVIAKISTYFKGLLLQVCNMYLKLKPYLEKLQIGEFKWEQELNLPDDLWSWCKHQEPFDINGEDLPADKVRLVAEMLQKSNAEPTRKEDEQSRVNDMENELVDKNCPDIQVIDIEESLISNAIESDIEVVYHRKKNKVKTKKKKKETRRHIEIIDLEEDDEVYSKDVEKVKRKKKRLIESSPSKTHRKKGKSEEVIIMTEVEVRKKKKKLKESNDFSISKNQRKLEIAVFGLRNDILNARTFERLLSIWEDLKTDSKFIKHKHLTPPSAIKLNKLFKRLKHNLDRNTERLKHVAIEAVAEMFTNHLIFEFNEC